MLCIKTICLLGVLGLCRVDGLLKYPPERISYSQANNVDKNVTVNVPETGVELHRHKRGWGSVLFTGASMLLRVTNLGLSLASALTEGCSYFPSICQNKHEIERLDGLIKGMTIQYEQEYVHVKQTYYDLMEATTNNGYISYYINSTMQIVETLTEIEDSLSAALEEKLPLFAGMYHASNESITFDQYLTAVVGTLEYRLSDLNKMLLQHKKNALIGIVIQYVVEAAVNRFINSFKNAYSHEHNLETTHAIVWEIMEGSEPTLSTKFGTIQKLKLVPKAFRQMARNVGQRFRDFGKNVKKWGRIKNWEGFKGKLAYTFRKPIEKLQKVQSFFKNPVFRAKFVKGYRLSWSQKITTGIGILADVISQALAVKNWSKVASQMDEAVVKHREHYEKLERNLKDLNEEKGNMSLFWNDAIDTFKHLSLPFRSIVENATSYKNFSDVLGLAKLPFNFSQNSLFTIRFENVNKQNVISYQLSVKGFLNDVYNNMTIIEDQMKARLVLYNNTLSKSENDESIYDMLSDVASILQFSPSMTMKTFGQQLTSQDLVCTVSVLRPDIPEYDFFPLEPFRPRCEVNASTFDNFKAAALIKRKSKLMKEVLFRNINTSVEESLSKLLDAIHNAYFGVSDKVIASFGQSVTSRDVICVISEEFPLRQTYDFVRLGPFRPDCSAVTIDLYNKLLHDAANLRRFSTTIKNNMKTCQDYMFCPCLSHVAKTNNVREADVVTLLKQLNPGWQPNQRAQFCGGPEGCGCYHL